MHIDVDPSRIQCEIQDEERECAFFQNMLVAVKDGVIDHAALNEAAIEIDELINAHFPGKIGPADETLQPDVVRRLVEFDKGCGVFLTKDVPESLFNRL